MFLRNSWYVVAWSHELTDRPFGRQVLGEPVVVYRGGDGNIAALEDRCAHRHMPLSMGCVVGNDLQCGYHGLTYDHTGACVRVPSQSGIPSHARVRSYPALEKFGWVWVWMGEAAKANPAMVPDFHWLNDPAFAAVGKTNHVQCAYQLVTDNLMDLSHVGFVHTTTIGNAEFGEKGRLTARRSETGVTVKRLVPDVPTPPTYIQLGVLPAGKNIDRWQIVDFIPPCFVRIHVGGKEAGTGALEGRFEQGLNMWVINAMTPETEHSTHYFWANVRQHALGDKRIDELLFSQVSAVFEEDRVVLEAQQRSLLNRADTWSVALRQDEGSILARRVVEKMIEDERGK